MPNKTNLLKKVSYKKVTIKRKLPDTLIYPKNSKGWLKKKNKKISDQLLKLKKLLK